MSAITFDDIIRVAVVIMALWGFYKVIMEIVRAITARHDREQSWDTQSKEMSEKYDKAVKELNNRIETNQKEMKEELFILTKCMQAVLDGLHQQGCNGKVTEARNMLDEYLIDRAHD